MRDRGIENQAPLRLTVCGKLAIEAGDLVLRERELPARQGRRLWCYLVLERRRSCRRDELAGALWGDDAPDGWDTVLSGVMSRLRGTMKPLMQAVPGFELTGDTGGYHLQLPSNAFVDFERARKFARSWNAQLVEVGDQGHINTASGHGEWREGRSLLARMIG